MIESIEIHNFKSIKDLTLKPKALNLLMGLNGMGKSTLIQSLLLLRQNFSSSLQTLLLNGELINIGRGQDALYGFAETEEIEFKFGFSDSEKGRNDINMRYGYEKESDILPLIDGHMNIDSLFSEPLFTDSFVCLNAERISPASAYDTSFSEIQTRHRIGTHGELAIHLLSLYGNSITVAEPLRLDNAKSSNLNDQVEAWLNIISPGVSLDIDEISNIDKVVLSYRFDTDTIRSNNFRPTNVGFGITYILPILVACLSGLYDLIIIENPEAHIHPKGQAKIGELLSRCAEAGKQLFVETHSDHIVNGIRVSAKKGIINPKSVQINYFTKKVENGESYTVNNPIRIDKNGSFSDYPDDFMDEWENRLLDLL